MHRKRYATRGKDRIQAFHKLMKILYLRSLSLAVVLVLAFGSCFPALADREKKWTVCAVERTLIMPGYRLTNEKEVNKAWESVYASYKNRIENRRTELTSGQITIDGNTMKVYLKTIGKPGPNGYPVYISLHGGGTTNQAVQNEQFEFMKSFHDRELSSGLYIVPKGIIASGDEHFRPESFLFYDRIIENAIAFHNADPNRVYLTGFSSGGDGVYAIAPAIPDRFAAAEMCAGCPSHMKFENLRNLPFLVQMGEWDEAYGRNTKAAQVDGILNMLAVRYKGYRHRTFIHAGYGHNGWEVNVTGHEQVFTGREIQKWLEGKKAKVTHRDTRSIRWLEKYKRDPLPQKVVWNTAVCAAKRPIHGIYWLDRDGLLQNVTVVASYDRAHNAVKIEECDAKEGTLKVLLNSSMVDLFKDVSVTVAGITVKVKPICSRQIMESTLELRGDPNLVFTSEIDIRFDAEHHRIEVEPVYRHISEYSVKEPDRLMYWDQDRVFHVDQSLFGLTRKELSSKLGLPLGPLEPWPYYGTNVYWTYVNFNDRTSVIFMFQNQKCVMIYSEWVGRPTPDLEQAAMRQFGGTWNTLADEGMARYYLDDNHYDGVSHTVQQHQYYAFWFQR